MKVKELLAKKSTAGVICTTPDDTLHTASKLLAEHRIGAVVVLGPDDTPVGILSERDIVRLVAQRGADALALPVRDAMTKDIIIALPDDQIAYLSSTMTDKRIRHLPVIDGKKLVGIVSIGDVVKAQRDYFEGEAHLLQQYIDRG